MFHLYWPVIALVAAVTIVAIVLVLMLGGRLCGDRWVRTNALPDRPLKTYLPETEDDAIFQAVQEQRSAPFPSGFREVEESPSTHLELEPQIQFHEQEPVNLSYSNPDASMSPEGRREFGAPMY